MTNFSINEYKSLFLEPLRIVEPISWIKHIPFAFFIIELLKPKIVVELGVHTGNSFSAFCQAVKYLNIKASCYGVDTFKGDPHSGVYDEFVYIDINNYITENYGDFAQLMRMTFDEALEYFSDGSIDLLHIDGYHTYEAVKHDFESWLPKMSDRGVILLHDTQVRRDEFGAWKLWEEISKLYPSYEFKFGYGLGVLAVGKNAHDVIIKFIEEAREKIFIERLFFTFGSNIEFRTHIQRLEGEVAEVRNTIAQKDERVRELEANLEDRNQRIQRLEGEVREIKMKNLRINTELNSIKSSVTWRTVMKWHSFVEKLMPPMTRRRGWYDLGIIGLRTIANEGWRSFWWKYRQRRRKVKQESTHHGENFFQEKDKDLDLEKIIEDYVHYTSPRKFRVLYITGAPDLPSNRYRVYNFEEYLSDFEIETNHINQFEISDKLDEILTFDLIVMFRVAMDENLTRLIDICRKLNIPTIFDVDDYVFEPKIATVEYIDGIRFLPKEELSLYFEGVKRYRKTLLSCDYFTTTTEYLAERSKELGKKAFVLRNGLNKEIVEITKRVKESYKKEDNFIKIGYFSGTKTHQKDFAVVVGGIRRILSEYNNVKLLIGGYLDLKEFPELDKFKDRIETLPWVPWQKLPFNIIKADINIAPLEVGNPFSEAKSELKYFEAALLKIPTIASPTDAFKYAIKDGVNGFLAKDENEWYTKLKNLIENEELRRKIGERAYEHSLGEYSAPSLSKVLLDTYKKILVDYKRSKGISADSLSIGIILPPPFSGSGGHMRVFEIGKILSDMGHKVKVYITDSQDFMNSREIEKFIRRNFIDPNFKVVLGVDKITSCDVLIATHWSTAYIVHRYRGRAAKTFHFVQDYEPYFYSMSEDYINADLSYGLADVIITYGKWCYELLKRKNKISSKQKIYRIPFYVNKTIFHPIDNVERKRNRVLFFARPDMPRRLYGLGIKVLKIVASKKPDVEIIFYGSKNINSSKIPFKHKNLGYLRTQHNLVKLYNSATVGLIFTTTNPSMTSFEMMACKCPVVDIKYNNNELNYGDVNNAMLVEPTPECVAEGIIKLLEDDELRNRIAENGYKYVASFPDMEDSLSKFIHILKKEIDDENEVA